MLAQRAAQQSLRRLAIQQPAFKFASPAAIATGNVIKVQRRCAAATSISEQTEQKNILTQQRLNRPVAPHLMIYKAQVTWYLSALNRITGSLLSGGFYLFGTLYLVAPYIGLQMSSITMATAFGAWPVALKVFTKAMVAWPFTFHCLNGVRHLIWDTTNMITNKKVQQSGWTVVALSTVGALALAFM